MTTEFATTFGAMIERDVLEVVGPDATGYLQGQLSQNVESMAEGDSRRALLLQPQGKVDAWFRVTRLGPERFWLDTDPGHGQGALDRLNRFKLRVDVEISLVTMATFAVRGPGAADGPAALGVVPADGAVVADALWPGIDGFDVLGEITDTGSVEVRPGAALDDLRIRLGVPAMGRELDGSTIPAAAGIVDLSVDFDKGCYVGQELVARIDSRGSNTPTNLRGLRLPAAAEIAPGGTLMVDGANVGTVTSVSAEVGNDGERLALAYVRRAVEVPATVTVAGADGAELAAAVVALPFD
ncbi:MAG: hypothetical protein AAGD35_17820 [Actinomycetota bacterium]